MKIIDELLPGTFLLQPDKFSDERGDFVKTFHKNVWDELGLKFEMKEEFYSSSKKNVIRGMHFQLPPDAHDKVVFCLAGAVLDVVVDLRAGGHYGQVASVELSAENLLGLFIPVGVAHGFLSMVDGTLMLYKTSTVHNPQSDCGISWTSFGFDWGIADPIISKRDSQHPQLTDFSTPFQQTA